MTNNVLGFTLGLAQVEAIDAAVTTLKQSLPGLIALSLGEKRLLKRMGEKSETFCRQSLHVMDRNRQLVPAKIDLDAAIETMRTLDLLRPRLVELAQLLERCYDTDAALGSAVMTVALQGYSLLKLIGRSEGLEPLRRELQAGRFKQKGGAAAAKARRAAAQAQLEPGRNTP